MQADFQIWKDEFERETSSQFVKATGEKNGAVSKITYYYCNRSGFFKNKGKGVRYSKTQGSDKLDAYCTASITVTEQIHRSSNQIIVDICKTHYGHSCLLGHTRIQSSNREAMRVI